jgi:hypothetical protein
MEVNTKTLGIEHENGTKILSKKKDFSFSSRCFLCLLNFDQRKGKNFFFYEKTYFLFPVTRHDFSRCNVITSNTISNTKWKIYYVNNDACIDSYLSFFCIGFCFLSG